MDIINVRARANAINEAEHLFKKVTDSHFNLKQYLNEFLIKLNDAGCDIESLAGSVETANAHANGGLNDLTQLAGSIIGLKIELKNIHKTIACLQLQQHPRWAGN